MKVDPLPPPVLGVSDSSKKGLLHTFATPFSREIMEAPHLKKVKMSSIKPFDGTTDPDEATTI